ncbi:MAG: hypothetical protein EOP88_16060 [Verrucomicrobiaceae bacterium]|nr:MAG: hypothetical protein EOP88_16060 [Verrucomicrobiaceae bacterium]
MVSISAAEIVAWKVPLKRYSYESDQWKRLDAPPEASPFFRPGDELQDVGKPSGKDAPEVDWAVWNETTGTLVTKSSVEETWPLMRMLDPRDVPRLCRLRIEVLETPGDGPADPDSKPAHALEWTTGSGIKSSASNGTEGKQINAEADVTLGETGQWADLSLAASFQLPGQERMTINTGVLLKSGCPMRVAGDRSNGKGMEVTVSFNAILIDGSPLADTIRIQQDGRSIPIIQSAHSTEIQRIGGNMLLWQRGVEPEQFLPNDTQEAADPFAEPGPMKKEPSELERLKVVKVPETIAGRFLGPVLDISGIIAAQGINFTEAVDFAGYDVMSETMVFLTTSEQEAEKMEQLMTPMCGLRVKMVSAGCENEGEIHVMSRSSRKAYIARGADDNNPVRSFDLEPVVGETGLLLLKFRYQDRSSPAEPVLLDTSVTVEDGRAVEVMEGGPGMPLKMKGTVVEQ